MLYRWIRVLDSDNGILSDFSLDNQNESANMPFDLVATEDFIYIGQHFPTNNLFIQPTVVNDQASLMSVDYWDSNAWISGVDILDGTSVNGASLAQDGLIQFSPNNSNRWAITTDTTDSNAPTELNNVTMYNLYWLRIKFSVSLNVLTTISRITYAFTLHQQINNLDTTINDYLTDFAAGKTSWNDEIVTSSLHVIADLKRLGLIIHPGQVLMVEDISMATDWRTLMHIYRNLGGDYQKKFEKAQKEYQSAIDLKQFTFDTDKDAFADRNEILDGSRRLIRS